jgi:hypothetical protein
MTSLGQPVSRPGRPSLPQGDRKRARNLSISDAAWKKLEEHLQTLPIKTASELVEKIGLGQIQLAVLEDSPLGDVPICRRLKALIAPPVAVLWSILAFVRRTCYQFNLEPTDDRVYSVTLRACTVVFYTGYTHPDVLINNPSALIKWLCYWILQAEAVPASPKPDCPSDPAEVQRVFSKISHAFDKLELAARSPDYKALKMKTMDGLTIKQISRIFKLQKLEVSKVEVSRMIKQGLVNFRELFYDDLEEYPPRLDSDPSAHKLRIQDAAQAYLQLALQKTLHDKDSRRQMQEILWATSDDPYLDFWLNEIDYSLRPRPAQTKKAHELDAIVRDRLAQDLDEHLQQKKRDIDRQLAFCQTAAQIQHILQDYSDREIGTKLPLEWLMANG